MRKECGTHKLCILGWPSLKRRPLINKHNAYLKSFFVSSLLRFLKTVDAGLISFFFVFRYTACHLLAFRRTETWPMPPKQHGQSASLCYCFLLLFHLPVMQKAVAHRHDIMVESTHGTWVVVVVAFHKNARTKRHPIFVPFQAAKLEERGYCTLHLMDPYFFFLLIAYNP